MKYYDDNLYIYAEQACMDNNGQLSQQQYNNIVNQANQLQKTPQFMQFLNNLNFPH